jgi:hypothetical protein
MSLEEIFLQLTTDEQQAQAAAGQPASTGAPDDHAQEAQNG